jgi:hypothetical protein
VQVEALRIGVVVEQLLGEQDADDVVLALADHREARVPVSTTSGMNSGTSSSIDTQSICARGIMMSRTVVSDTDSTPSIIDSASPSSSLRSNAPQHDGEQVLAVLGLAHQQRGEQRSMLVVVHGVGLSPVPLSCRSWSCNMPWITRCA